MNRQINKIYSEILTKLDSQFQNLERECLDALKVSNSQTRISAQKAIGELKLKAYRMAVDVYLQQLNQ